MPIKWLIFTMRHAKHIPKPDLDQWCWDINRGEFSDETEEAFNKHIKRLHKAADFFKNENGRRMKLIIREESLWYPARTDIVTNKPKNKRQDNQHTGRE